MQIPITSPRSLGMALRAARKASGVRIDDMAAAAGVSKQFLSDLENGKEGVRLGLVLKLMHELGAAMSVDIPDAAASRYEALRRQDSGTESA